MGHNTGSPADAPPISDRRREQLRLAAKRYLERHPDRPRLTAKRYRKAHPDRVKASRRATYAAHREESQAYRKAYYAAHKEDEARRRRLWRERHPEYERLWQETHKESVRLRMRAYAQANPDIQRATDGRRRAQKRGTLASLTTPQWRAIVAAYKGKCAYCGAKPKKLTIDHVLPLARGGHHSAENVVPACMPCNQHKSAGPPPLIPSLRLLL